MSPAVPSSLLLLALGCAPESPSAAPAADQPPPWVPVLDVSPLVPGQVATLSVDGAPKGSQVWVLGSVAGPGAGPCHPSYPGACLDLAAPVRVLAGGVVSVAAEGFDGTWTVPAGLDGRMLYLQAFTASSPVALASGVTARLVGDADRDWVHDAHDDCPDVADPTQYDADADGFGEACDCDDADAGAFPGATDATVDHVDQDCDGVDGPPGAWDGAWTGTADLYVQELGGSCPADVLLQFTDGADPEVTGEVDCGQSPLFDALGIGRFEVTGTFAPGDTVTLELTDADDSFTWTGTDATATLGAPGFQGTASATLAGDVHVTLTMLLRMD